MQTQQVVQPPAVLLTSVLMGDLWLYLVYQLLRIRVFQHQAVPYMDQQLPPEVQALLEPVANQ